MGSQAHLLWHETSSGQYEREIDESEQFYTSMAKIFEGTGHTYFAITAYTGVSIPIPPNEEISKMETRVMDALQYAWKRVRYDHPTLAAPVEYDPSIKKCKKIYRTPQNDAEVEEWVRETLKFINNGMTGLEFANSDPVVGRFATLYVITPSQTSDQSSLKRDLFFRSHHDLIDGIGTLIFFNNLLGHFSVAFNSPDDRREIVFGDEHKNLSPPFRIAAEIPPTPSQSQLSKLKDMLAATVAATKDAKILSVPFKSTTPMPKQSQRIATHLTAAETHAVLSKCKVLGATVTQAFHAAIALAVRDVQQREEQERKAKYVSYSLVNLRRACKAPYNAPLHAAAVYHCISANNLIVDLTVPGAGQPLAVELKEEFEQVLEQVKTFYQSFNPDADYLAIVPSLFAGDTLTYPHEPVSVPPPNMAPSVSLSSMGIVDKIIRPKYETFEVEEPWVIGAEYSTGLGLFLGTWNGVLCLSAGYNEAFHSKEDAMSFLQRVNNVVLEGLEVKIAPGA